jgi:superfamily II DNA helicase RecQ
MIRANLIAIEDAEYEKVGEVKRYRKVRLTETGLKTRNLTHLELLLDDGIEEEFASPETHKRARKTSKRDSIPAGNATNRNTPQVTRRAETAPPQTLSADDEALAARLKEWRTGEAKRLRVPAYCVMHDRTITAVAFARPTNPRQLLEIDGIGPTKVEKFGPAIIEICEAKLITDN